MGPSHTMETAVIIPVYNHPDTVRKVTEKAVATGLPVIVVDDGSEVEVSLFLKGISCYILRFDENRGKGAAILEGLKLADSLGFDAAITIDADGQHDPADAKIFLKAIPRASWPAIIVGCRKDMKRPHVPPSSLFGKKFSNFWFYIETGLAIKDTQSGFRLYPVREVLELPISSRRYDFEIEVLVKAAWSGIPIKEVDIKCSYPEARQRISHFHMVKDNLRLTVLHASLVLSRLLFLDKFLSGRRSGYGFNPNECLFAFRHPIGLLKQICSQHAAPSLLAAATWLGLFLGALPLIACHTVVILFVAHRLHLNKVAAVGASQFCCPPFVPFLCIEAGHFVLHGNFLGTASWQSIVIEIHLRLFEWLVGSMIVGPVLGIIGAVVVYWLSAKIKAIRKPERVSQ